LCADVVTNSNDDDKICAVVESIKMYIPYIMSIIKNDKNTPSWYVEYHDEILSKLMNKESLVNKLKQARSIRKAYNKFVVLKHKMK